MAYVNVAEWKTDQVCEWLKGLDNSVLPYVHSFMNHGINGQQLLNLRSENLEHLGVLKLGHQEIILEAVEYLRNFHYELDRENLQLLALRLSCQAHSLYKELSRQTDSKPVTTQTLSDVVSVVMTVKPVVRWLDRSPFSGQLEYNDKKTTLMKLSLEMATCAQRDRFAEKPIEEIRTTCEQLAKLADYIIQDITDPMILQPASLDLATLKKKSGDDLGFYILPSFHGSHQIAEIKFGTAAHQCGKMEEGDEIVQINYQTVVGWERKSVLELFRESPAEILLTLKRRPRHTKVYGQIYIKPYRLPSNKKISYTSRWQHNLPSPRPELLTIPDFTMPLPRHPPKNPSPEPTCALNTVCMLDTMATDSSDSDCEVEQPLSIRLYSAKPRNLVQRRATITGASPTTKYGIDIEQFWKELKQEHNTTFQLRDKAASCAHGLDNVLSNLRPQTCLGIEQTKRRKKNDNQVDEKKVQFQEKLTELDVTYTDNTKNINHDIKEENKFPMKYHENSIIANKKICTEISQTAANTTSNNNLSDISVPLDECNNLISDRSNFSASMLTGKETDTRNIKERGKLDKSYSTPAYDLMNIDDTLDRKLMLFENSFCKTDIPIYISTLKNLPNINSTKTDGTVTLEDMEDTTKAININNKDNESVSLGIIGNVAQKINNIEKYIQYNDTEESMCVFKVPEQIDMCRNSVCIKVNDISFKNNTEKDQSNIECIIPDKNKCVKYHIMNNLSIEAENSIKNNNSDGNFDNLSENYSSSREDSEEKSESTSSYLEGCSSNSEDITIKKFDKVLQSVDCVLTNQAKVDKKYLALLLKENTTEMPEQASSMYTYASDSNDLQYIVRHISQIRINSNIQNNDVHDSCSNVSEDGTHHCQYTELSNNMNRRIEVKSQLTPPEPPPRKYFTKSETPNLGSISKSTTNQAKPQIPLKPHVRRDLKKTDIYTKNQIKSVSDYNENESFSVYSNLTEKSLDFIDESNLVTDNNQKSTLPINNSAFSESNDKQLNEEKLYFDKYEPFVEKFATTNQSTFECCKSDNYPRNIDFLYSPGYSKQAQLLDFKSSSNKLSEKDKSFEKGVVNKAMMVARSIGLHGSLNKSSSNSPRSNRKRNMLLAKKRNVSVKDVGTGDLEGWLTYRSRGAGGAWAKAWFVLKCSSLYRFKTQISTKADCLIALPGFTISQATEVKSRKYAFKVYHTGTVFYFAADTEDCLNIWLDAVNKATLGTDSYNRNSSLFSETDESDGECKSKPKFVNASDIKINAEKSFGSLKKVIRKESNFKDHEIGASLDRKYLRFLSTRNQNIPVPTAQFRSYRRVLPSTVNKKQDSTPNSPDLQVTIAGSTFYGLSTSQSTTDMSNTNQDMGDYRRTSDRCISHRVRRPDDLHGFITLEEFMLSQQDEEQRQSTINRSASPHNTPLSSDHIHIQHTNFSDTCIPNEQSSRINDISSNNEVTYYQTKNSDETPSPNSDVLQGLSKNSHISYKMHPSNIDFTINQNENKFECTNEKVCIKCQHPSIHKKKREPNNVTKKRLQEILPQQQIKQNESSNWRNVVNEHTQSFLSCHGKSDVPNYSTRHRDINLDQNMYVPTIEIQSTSTHEINNPDDHPFPKDIGSLIDLQVVSKKLNKNKGYSGSNSDLTSFVSSETLQRAKKDASISRKGSFNLTNRDRDNSVEKHWLDSLRRDKKNSNCDKNRLKNVAQYQPPPIPTTPFEQEGMRAAFEMHLDKNEQVQKANRLKSLFGTKCYQKPCTLNLPKDSQKTLLGSPRLHRALFREKSSSQQQHRLSTSSGAQSPGDSRISQSLSSFSANSHFHNPNHMYSSVNSINDVSSDSSVSSTSNTSKYNFNQQSCQKGLTASGRKSLPPPKLPYIPPPTSPPPDYPGLEYPPVFEPGTYSLSDASLLRNRSKSNHNNTQ